MGQHREKEAVARNASCTSRPGLLCSFPVTLANLSGSPPSTNSNTGSEEQTSTALSWSISHTRSMGDLLSIVFLRGGPTKTVLKRPLGDKSLWFGHQQCPKCPFQVGTKVITVCVLWTETKYRTRRLVCSPLLMGARLLRYPFPDGWKAHGCERCRHTPTHVLKH